jgi:hypothetical protein
MSGSPTATVINPAKRALYLNAQLNQSFVFWGSISFFQRGVKFPLPIAIPLGLLDRVEQLA